MYLEVIRFCDDNTKALAIKSVTMGGGGSKKCPNMRDVIYGRPLRCLISNVSI